MDNKRTIFLDTNVLLELGKFPDWAETVRNFIEQNNFVLVIGVMHLIEIYKWKRYWSEIADFISSVPFVISEKPENITDVEVANYPNEIPLPTTFESTHYQYSKDELKQAIEVNLKEKVYIFEKNYRSYYRSIWQGMLDTRKTYPPSNGKNYSDAELKVFFLMNVMTWLNAAGHQAFLRKKVDASEVIILERFKSIYLPLVAILVEYYVGKKNGKPSDVGDFYQLGIIPYVDISVLDNERHDLIERVKRQELFPQALSTYNISKFKEQISKM